MAKRRKAAEHREVRHDYAFDSLLATKLQQVYKILVPDQVRSVSSRPTLRGDGDEDRAATSASVRPRGCSPIWRRGSAEDCECIFGGSGGTGQNASRSCAVEAFRSSLPRLRPVHRRGSGACRDIRRFKWHCATTSSILSAYPDSTLHAEAQPGRTAEVRDPYARWCGRGGAARLPPIPISGRNCPDSGMVGASAATRPAVYLALLIVAERRKMQSSDSD